VEEQFYLIIPVLVYLLSRRALVAVFMAGILLQPILQWASPGFHAYVLALWRAGPLLSGALLAILVRWPPFVEMVKRNAVAVRVAMIVLVASAGAMALQPLWFSALKYTWLAMFYTAFVLVAYLNLEPGIGTILRSRILVWFGQLSYGIYMFHQPISGLVHGWIRGAKPEIHSGFDAGLTLVALVVALSAAALSFYLMEQPILRLGHQFKYRRRERITPLQISYAE
jgi:peptidoglycan/LPS O-acetylase OafA/YrhL